jgi:Ca-activated chloride channel family protein
MAKPTIELIPVRSGARSDQETTLDVLLKITPPPAEARPERPALNLGLVIDRSGSMGEANKIDYARDAAAFIVRELIPSDRISITIFDDQIETLVPSTPATDKDAILNQIAGIQPRNSTDLHGGWAEGGRQVSSQMIPGGLNRVLLLSDGLANCGETRPDEIATRVHALGQTGVSTSTFGLGRHYNEDLLEGMARSGDGNYYYIESANQLPIIFGNELRGLSATMGTDVKLRVNLAAGISLADALNDFTQKPDGRYELPHLIAGVPVYVVLKFQIPPGSGEREIAQFQLEYRPPKAVDHESQTLALRLPALESEAFEKLVPVPEVEERSVLLAVARQRKQATLAADQHDLESAAALIAGTIGTLGSIPLSAEVERELEAIKKVQQHLDEGDAVTFSKRAKYHSYQRHMSKPYDD